MKSRSVKTTALRTELLDLQTNTISISEKPCCDTNALTPRAVASSVDQARSGAFHGSWTGFQSWKFGGWINILVFSHVARAAHEYVLHVVGDCQYLSVFGSCSVCSSVWVGGPCQY